MRIYFPYGPGQSDRLVPRLISRILKGEAISLHGENVPQINPVYIEDLTALVSRALLLPEIAPILHLAGRESISIKGLCDLIGDLTEISPRFERPSGGDLPHISNMLGDAENTYRWLSYRPNTDLRTGLRQTLQHQISSHS